MSEAVVYCAKSTQDRKASIPDQLIDCREMAAENGWTVIGEFSDENFSAYSGNRGPGLEAAKRRATEAARKSGSIVMLVAQAHDRFARGAGDAPGAPQSLGELWHELRRKNVHLRTVEDDEEMRDEQTVAAIGRRAYIDSRRKSKSVKKGLARRARDRGKLAGGPRPYGYEYVGERPDRSLVIIPAEALIVVRIYQDTIAGMSQLGIARQLNREGVSTISGNPWGQPTVRAILMNPLYRGSIKHAGEVYPGAHKAIVTEEMWNQADAIRSSKTRSRGGRWPRGSHLLTHGLGKCGTCGWTLVPRTDPGRRGASHQTYRCDGRYRNGPDFCPQPPIDRQVIDEAMLGELNETYLDLDATRQRLEARHATDTSIAAEALRHAEAEVQKAGERIGRVERGFQDGFLEAGDYSNQRTQLRDEQEAAMAALQRAQSHLTDLESTGGLQDAEEAVLRHLADLRAAIAEGIEQAPNLNALRTLLRRLFERVIYLPEGHQWLTQVSAMRESGVQIKGAVLVPFLREGAIESIDLATYVPKIRRSTLPLGETTDGNSLDR
jgi:site-specific DNA recombinase